MKTRSFLLAAGVMLALAFTFSCDSGGGGGNNPYVGNIGDDITYIGTSGGVTYTLEIKDGGSRTASKPTPGDSYTLTQSGKTSTGTVISFTGGTLTLKPSRSNSTPLFTTTVSGNGITAMSGDITYDDGTTSTAPSTLTPSGGGGGGNNNCGTDVVPSDLQGVWTMTASIYGATLSSTYTFTANSLVATSEVQTVSGRAAYTATACSPVTNKDNDTKTEFPSGYKLTLLVTAVEGVLSGSSDLKVGDTFSSEFYLNTAKNKMNYVGNIGNAYTKQVGGGGGPSSSSNGGGGGSWCVDHDYEECTNNPTITSSPQACASWYGVLESSCPPGYDIYSDGGENPSSSSNGGGGGSWCVDHEYQECTNDPTITSSIWECVDWNGVLESTCPPSYDRYSGGGGGGGDDRASYCRIYSNYEYYCLDMQDWGINNEICREEEGEPVNNHDNCVLLPRSY